MEILTVAGGNTPREIDAKPDSATLTGIGESLQLTATVWNRNGHVLGSVRVSWTSLEPLVATVDATGLVTATGAGTARIIVTSGSIADTSIITVNQMPIATVSLSPSTATLEAGDSVQLIATAADSNAVPVIGAPFTWSTSNAAVASVSASGMVEGVSAGEATITATTAGQSATAGITVTSKSQPPPPSACSGHAYQRLVQVSGATQLADALKNAQPGDLIWLSDGTYSGEFSTDRSGTATQRIVLCGSRAAVLQGKATSSGYGFLLKGSYWTLDGFSVTNSQFGVYLNGASHNLLTNLAVYRIGQEAVRFRSFSSYNTLQNSQIYDTGLYVAEYGEGVYIGSYFGQWATNSSGQPDASDYNQVLNNIFGPNVRSEHIDVKEGTTGGVISGNTFNGAGMVASQTWVDSWIELKGNSYTVTDNVGDQTIRDGFEVYQALPGWGNNNVFRNNTADVKASGYGFNIKSGTTGNVVECKNTVKNAGLGFSNVKCS
ncbi:MAG: Ig-like domain-containing protein [Gemmatimonadetes bacterium]|nr:Ig-like domain-containing protein [Gemmatimonadota bacterium]